MHFSVPRTILFDSLTAVYTFLGSAKEQFEVLNTMYSQMDSIFKEIGKFYAFDPKKYTMEDFFADIKVFKDGFVVIKDLHTLISCLA